MEAGLSKALSDVPLREGFLEASAGFDQGLGGWARGEVGVHILPKLGFFGFAQDSTRAGFSAGAGARFNFDL